MIARIALEKKGGFSQIKNSGFKVIFWQAVDPPMGCMLLSLLLFNVHLLCLSKENLDRFYILYLVFLFIERKI